MGKIDYDLNIKIIERLETFRRLMKKHRPHDEHENIDRYVKDRITKVLNGKYRIRNGDIEWN